MSKVICRDLTKRFGDVIAVNKLNLEVEDREFIVLVGPSGCGKTTALRMVAGLESVSGGEILIDDLMVNGVPPGKRDIAMVFQNYALYPHMRVFDNIAYSLRLRHTPKHEIEQRVNATAKLLGIETLLGRWPKQLSGGQRQRVALGRAIIREPRAFLMDEPLSNLDAQLRVQMRREIIHLQRNLGITTIYVTHDQVEAMTMGDRIVVMKDGLVQQIGAPDEVYRRPRNAFVARFIGSPSMNMTNGELVSEDGELLFRSSNLRVPLPGVAKSALGQAGSPVEVSLGVRPEDVILDENGGTGLSVARGTVDLVEHLGSDAYASVKVGSDLILARVSPDVQLRDDQPVGLGFNPAKLHLFDGKTGESLLLAVAVS